MTSPTSAGSTRPFTGTPSQVVVEQLAALGVRYVFNNTGSHEATRAWLPQWPVGTPRWGRSRR